MMRKSAGFTLVEVMLATVLFALLMSSYYIVLEKVLALQTIATEERSFASIAPSILDVIEDDIQSFYTSPTKPEAFPFRGADDSLGSEPADRLNFVVRRRSLKQEEIGSKGRFVRSPVNEAGYRLDRARGGADLRRLFRREGYYVDQSPLDGGDYFEVYDRVVSFDVVYAGYPSEEKERADGGTVGTHKLEKFESWDSEERKAFPTAILVTLTVEAPSPAGAEESERDREKNPPRRMTMVRIIPLPQAYDAARPAQGSQPGSTGQDPRNPGGAPQPPPAPPVR